MNKIPGVPLATTIGCERSGGSRLMAGTTRAGGRCGAQPQFEYLTVVSAAWVPIDDLEGEDQVVNFKDLKKPCSDKWGRRGWDSSTAFNIEVMLD
ncbi:uncharacterized protein BO66DRAFT_388992 [Aspergillus aculeatinus CBS 121060]|uniref:Uncharacterized protein n=1 Tax=Aspergillus aculeatinus CBS 121060 TaxID=1448322 RepID=A0ACD1HJ21_9EURO|nr:hypothetical protein BO66DRAFT_388992 [Aspergillus aculeatinus CBS 121060]RAH73407.1 hypothetical protein BO66DRAFT_388992 [Aspergillus aculeatinus CBS 121060]